LPSLRECFGQYCTVSDVVGQYQHQLGHQHVGLFIGHIALGVDQLLIKAVGGHNVGVVVQWHGSDYSIQ